MPRFARAVVPGCPHHVTQRGNAHRDVFFTATDRYVYLGLLKQYAQLYELRILGYCLMTNHVHIVAVPETETSLARTFREVHGRYASYRNALERTTGHVWQNRFYSCAIEDGHLARVMRYVERNPLRAGLVQQPWDYRWSSVINHLGGKGDPEIGDDLVDVSEWSRQWTPEEWARVLERTDENYASIRGATHSGRPLGSDAFVAQMEERLGRKLAARPPGRPLGRKAKTAAS